MSSMAAFHRAAHSRMRTSSIAPDHSSGKTAISPARTSATIPARSPATPAIATTSPTRFYSAIQGDPPRAPITAATIPAMSPARTSATLAGGSSLAARPLSRAWGRSPQAGMEAPGNNSGKTGKTAHPSPWSTIPDHIRHSTIGNQRKKRNRGKNGNVSGKTGKVGKYHDTARFARVKTRKSAFSTCTAPASSTISRKKRQRAATIRMAGHRCIAPHHTLWYTQSV